MQRGVTSRWGIPPNPISLTFYPLQGLPLYGEDATRKVAETDDFSPFWYRGTRDKFFIMARRAFAPSGRAMIFYIPAFAALEKGLMGN